MGVGGLIMSITFVSIPRLISYDLLTILYEGQDGHGMVVRVYGGAELENYENGTWGKYFN